MSKRTRGGAHQGKKNKSKWDNKSTQNMISVAISKKLGAKGNNE